MPLNLLFSLLELDSVSVVILDHFHIHSLTKKKKKKKKKKLERIGLNSKIEFGQKKKLLANTYLLNKQVFVILNSKCIYIIFRNIRISNTVYNRSQLLQKSKLLSFGRNIFLKNILKIFIGGSGCRL